MKLIRIMAFVFVMATSAFAADIKEYMDGPTGVAVKLNDNGTIKSLVTSAESELIFGDRKDEKIATQEATLRATLRAKANIAKFMSESLLSNEVMDDLAKIASDATAEGKTPTSCSLSKQILEKQRTIIRNNSDAISKGLILLTTETIRDKKYIKVVLGTDDKLMLAAVVSAAGVPTSKPAATAPAAEKAAPAAEKKVVKKAKKAKKTKLADAEKKETVPAAK